MKLNILLMVFGMMVMAFHTQEYSYMTENNNMMPQPLPKIVGFEQFLEAVIEIGKPHGYRVRPLGMAGYEKTYWRIRYDEGLTPQQAWDFNRKKT
jgi:hypothetical protein